MLQAAKKLEINYSSAKSIVQVFKREGRTKKMLIKKRMTPGENNAGKSTSGPMVSIAHQDNASQSFNQHKTDTGSADTLEKLRNKLLEGRKSVNSEREDFPPYKKLHQGNETTTGSLDMQQLDNVITQNNQILNTMGNGNPSANLQNHPNIVNITNNSSNISISSPMTQVISNAPNSNVPQQQVLPISANNTSANQYGGYVIVNPQNASIGQQNQGQQQVHLTPYNSQMQLITNPVQNSMYYPQQPGVVTMGKPYPQQYGTQVVVMMGPPNQCNNQPYYIAPFDGNNPSQQLQMQPQQPQPMIIQPPQFITMPPNSQQLGGYPQILPPQNGGFTVIQPQQISGFPQVQQPVVYMLPAGANALGSQHIMSANGQSFICPQTNPHQIPMQVVNTTLPANFSLVSQERVAESNSQNSNGALISNPMVMANPGPTTVITDKVETTDPSGATKKVVFDASQKPKLVSDLLNELKVNNSSNVNDRWLGLKVLTQKGKPE